MVRQKKNSQKKKLGQIFFLYSLYRRKFFKLVVCYRISVSLLKFQFKESFLFRLNIFSFDCQGKRKKFHSSLTNRLIFFKVLDWGMKLRSFFFSLPISKFTSIVKNKWKRKKIEREERKI